MPSHDVFLAYKGNNAFLQVTDANGGKFNFSVMIGPHKGTYTDLQTEGYRIYSDNLTERRKFFSKGGISGKRFSSQHWDVQAMFEFYDASRKGLLPPDLMYKGTTGGSRNVNTCAFLARLLKEGFKWKGVEVHAHGVSKWGPLALLDYAHRIQVALDRKFGKG